MKRKSNYNQKCRKQLIKYWNALYLQNHTYEGEFPKKKYNNCPPPCDKPCCTPNIEQKYDLACRIIALQKQQIQALTTNKARKS